MRKFILMIVIMILIVLLGGCNARIGKTTRVTVAINDHIYEVTDETVTSEELGVNIGTVNRQVSPKPEENGDIARNTSEGPPIIKSNGGKLYEIKGMKSIEQIAIETSRGMFCRCKYIGKLK